MFFTKLLPCLRITALLTGLLAAASASAEFVVIVGKGGPDAMTKEQVADVFLGKAASLPGGASAAQAKAYWSKLAFTGKGTPPPEAGNSAAVKKAVAGAPGGIGYIEKSAADATVKVVLTVN